LSQVLGRIARQRGTDLVLVTGRPRKQNVLPILRTASDRLPGSLVEEKDYSLVWHYRQADPELAIIRAQELADGLVQFTANMDLVVVPGHRTVEVRDSSVSKAHAALEFMANHDFVLAVGDDTTDEDMFRALPPTAYSIRVGLVGTHARFNVPGYEDVIALLALFCQERHPGPTESLPISGTPRSIPGEPE
jgi:trehalose 6-phosphate synthase/phosphatase